MKKLPLCALVGGAGFVIAGTTLLAQLDPKPNATALFLPLLWDAVMVVIGAAIILRCDCARRSGLVWNVFCFLATLAIGVAAFDWLLPQRSEPLGTTRIVFMLLTVGFGLVYSIWQAVAFYSPSVRAWVEENSARESPSHR